MILPSKPPTANQAFPSEPRVGPLTESAVLVAGGIWNSVIAPAVVMRPIMSFVQQAGGTSPNQRLPSTPAAIPNGPEPARGMLNSVIVPDGVMRAIALRWRSPTQRFPSGPAAIPRGSASARGSGNSVTVPAGVTRATMAVGWNSVTQTLPSGPNVMPPGRLVSSATWVITPLVLIL